VLLRNRSVEGLRGWRGLMLMAGLALALPIAVLLPLRGYLGGFFATLWPPSAPILTIGAALLGTVAVIVVAVRAQFAAQLLVDAIGIRYRSGWPAPFRVGADWQLRWSEVRAARAVAADRAEPLDRVIELVGEGRSARLVPWRWVDPSDASDLALTTEVRDHLLLDPRTAQRFWEETALVRVLAERARLDIAALEAAEADDDVQSSPTAITLAVGMIAAVLYGVVDIFFGLAEYYVRAPYLAFVAIGSIAAAFGWSRFAARHRRHPQTLAIVVMFGFGVGLAAYPLLLRVNAWTDQGGRRDHEYLLTDDGRWIAVDGDTPALTFDIGTGYWRQFQPGDRKTFTLRRGGLGFHQIDMRPIYREQREFYRGAG